jgi:hypothetical protein
MQKHGIKLGLMVASLAGASAMLASCLADSTGKNVQFDPASWKAADSLSDTTRCDMVTDLQERVGLKGLTEAEVIERLGNPDSHDDGSPMHYHLCPSFMDIRILELQFEAGRVASTRVRDT